MRLFFRHKVAATYLCPFFWWGNPSLQPPRIHAREHIKEFSYIGQSCFPSEPACDEGEGGLRWDWTNHSLFIGNGHFLVRCTYLCNYCVAFCRTCVCNHYKTLSLSSLPNARVAFCCTCCIYHWNHCKKAANTMHHLVFFCGSSLSPFLCMWKCHVVLMVKLSSVHHRDSLLFFLQRPLIF